MAQVLATCDTHGFHFVCEAGEMGGVTAAMSTPWVLVSAETMLITQTFLLLVNDGCTTKAMPYSNERLPLW